MVASRVWVAVALRATMDREHAFALHRRTECDGYQRREPLFKNSVILRLRRDKLGLFRMTIF